MRTVYVISDLHLGGEPGFQMCPPGGVKALAQFVRWIRERHAEGARAELVVAGDAVDFLAEKPFEAFTLMESAAITKLRSIFRSSEPFWGELAKLVEENHRLTLMLGNHDIELSLPMVRAELESRLGRGDVHFVDDNQCLVRGGALIEHGNRYDKWNAIPHDDLRRIRSALSRREPVTTLPVVPGSRLVIDVMNQIKRDHPFVDLLKPETETVLPFLGVLRSELWPDILNATKLYLGTRRNQFDENGIPTTPGNIAGDNGATAAPDESLARTIQATRAVAADGVAPARATFAFARGLREAWRARGEEPKGADAETKKQVARLASALQHLAAGADAQLLVEQELDLYLTPAKASAQNGFEVVVYGHTHLAKHVNEGMPRGAQYLNSGTWADLLEFPGTADRAKLEALADAITTGRIEALRRRIPTFVHLQIDESSTHASLESFDGSQARTVEPGSIWRYAHAADGA